MKQKKAPKGKFRDKGNNILKNENPNIKNMTDFLKHSKEKEITDSRHQDGNTQKHKSTYACPHIYVNPHTEGIPKKLVSGSFDQQQEIATEKTFTRLHVQIRKDLADKLLQEVFRRKQDGSIKNKDATQRTIIEQALESYFIKLNEKLQIT